MRIYPLLYYLAYIFINLLPNVVSENIESLGCWRDSSKRRALKSLENSHLFLAGPYKSRQNPVLKCAQVANDHGYNVFALQNGGECLSGPGAEHRYNMYGPSNLCQAGKGGTWSSNVYTTKTSYSRSMHPSLDPSPWDPYCSRDLDIVILLDGSGRSSKRTQNRWTLMKKFIVAFSKGFDEHARIGVVVFGSSPELLVDISLHLKPEEIEDRIKDIEMPGGNRDLNNAMKVAWREQLKHNNKSSADKVVLAITTGDLPYGLYGSTQFLSDHQIRVVAMGIDKEVHYEFLQSIASFRDVSNVFSVNSDTLLDAAPFLYRDICNNMPEYVSENPPTISTVTTTTTTTAAPTTPPTSAKPSDKKVDTKDVRSCCDTKETIPALLSFKNDDGINSNAVTDAKQGASKEEKAASVLINPSPQLNVDKQLGDHEIKYEHANETESENVTRPLNENKNGQYDENDTKNASKIITKNGVKIEVIHLDGDDSSKDVNNAGNLKSNDEMKQLNLNTNTFSNVTKNVTDLVMKLDNSTKLTKMQKDDIATNVDTSEKLEDLSDLLQKNDDNKSKNITETKQQESLSRIDKSDSRNSKDDDDSDDNIAAKSTNADPLLVSNSTSIEKSPNAGETKLDGVGALSQTLEFHTGDNGKLHVSNHKLIHPNIFSGKLKERLSHKSSDSPHMFLHNRSDDLNHPNFASNTSLSDVSRKSIGAEEVSFMKVASEELEHLFSKVHHNQEMSDWFGNDNVDRRSNTDSNMVDASALNTNDKPMLTQKNVSDSIMSGGVSANLDAVNQREVDRLLAHFKVKEYDKTGFDKGIQPSAQKQLIKAIRKMYNSLENENGQLAKSLRSDQIKDIFILANQFKFDDITRGTRRQLSNLCKRNLRAGSKKRNVHGGDIADMFLDKKLGAAVLEAMGKKQLAGNLLNPLPKQDLPLTDGLKDPYDCDLMGMEDRIKMMKGDMGGDSPDFKKIEKKPAVSKKKVTYSRHNIKEVSKNIKSDNHISSSEIEKAINELNNVKKQADMHQVENKKGLDMKDNEEKKNKEKTEKSMEKVDKISEVTKVEVIKNDATEGSSEQKVRVGNSPNKVIEDNGRKGSKKLNVTTKEEEENSNSIKSGTAEEKKGKDLTASVNEEQEEAVRNGTAKVNKEKYMKGKDVAMNTTEDVKGNNTNDEIEGADKGKQSQLKNGTNKEIVENKGEEAVKIEEKELKALEEKYMDNRLAMMSNRNNESKDDDGMKNATESTTKEEGKKKADDMNIEIQNRNKVLLHKILELVNEIKPSRYNNNLTAAEVEEKVLHYNLHAYLHEAFDDSISAPKEIRSMNKTNRFGDAIRTHLPLPGGTSLEQLPDAASTMGNQVVHRKRKMPVIEFTTKEIEKFKKVPVGLPYIYPDYSGEKDRKTLSYFESENDPAERSRNMEHIPMNGIPMMDTRSTNGDLWSREESPFNSESDFSSTYNNIESIGKGDSSFVNLKRDKDNSFVNLKHDNYNVDEEAKEVDEKVSEQGLLPKVYLDTVTRNIISSKKSDHPRHADPPNIVNDQPHLKPIGVIAPPLNRPRLPLANPEHPEGFQSLFDHVKKADILDRLFQSEDGPTNRGKEKPEVTIIADSKMKGSNLKNNSEQIEEDAIDRTVSNLLWARNEVKEEARENGTPGNRTAWTENTFKPILGPPLLFDSGNEDDKKANEEKLNKTLENIYNTAKGKKDDAFFIHELEKLTSNRQKKSNLWMLADHLASNNQKSYNDVKASIGNIDRHTSFLLHKRNGNLPLYKKESTNKLDAMNLNEQDLLNLNSEANEINPKINSGKAFSKHAIEHRYLMGAFNSSLLPEPATAKLYMLASNPDKVPLGVRENKRIDLHEDSHSYDGKFFRKHVGNKAFSHSYGVSKPRQRKLHVAYKVHPLKNKHKLEDSEDDNDGDIMSTLAYVGKHSRVGDEVSKLTNESGVDVFPLDPADKEDFPVNAPLNRYLQWKPSERQGFSASKSFKKKQGRLAVIPVKKTFKNTALDIENTRSYLNPDELVNEITDVGRKLESNETKGDNSSSISEDDEYDSEGAGLYLQPEITDDSDDISWKTYFDKHPSLDTSKDQDLSGDNFLSENITQKENTETPSSNWANNATLFNKEVTNSSSHKDSTYAIDDTNLNTIHLGKEGEVYPLNNSKEIYLNSSTTFEDKASPLIMESDNKLSGFQDLDQFNLSGKALSDGNDDNKLGRFDFAKLRDMSKFSLHKNLSDATAKDEVNKNNGSSLVDYGGLDIHPPHLLPNLNKTDFTSPITVIVGTEDQAKPFIATVTGIDKPIKPPLSIVGIDRPMEPHSNTLIGKTNTDKIPLSVSRTADTKLNYITDNYNDSNVSENSSVIENGKDNTITRSNETKMDLTRSNGTKTDLTQSNETKAGLENNDYKVYVKNNSTSSKMFDDNISKQKGQRNSSAKVSADFLKSNKTEVSKPALLLQKDHNVTNEINSEKKNITGGVLEKSSGKTKSEGSSDRNSLNKGSNSSDLSEHIDMTSNVSLLNNNSGSSDELMHKAEKAPTTLSEFIADLNSTSYPHTSKLNDTTGQNLNETKKGSSEELQKDLNDKSDNNKTSTKSDVSGYSDKNKIKDIKKLLLNRSMSFHKDESVEKSTNLSLSSISNGGGERKNVSNGLASDCSKPLRVVYAIEVSPGLGEGLERGKRWAKIKSFIYRLVGSFDGKVIQKYMVYNVEPRFLNDLNGCDEDTEYFTVADDCLCDPENNVRNPNGCSVNAPTRFENVEDWGKEGPRTGYALRNLHSYFKRSDGLSKYKNLIILVSYLQSTDEIKTAERLLKRDNVSLVNIDFSSNHNLRRRDFIDHAPIWRYNPHFNYRHSFSFKRSDIEAAIPKEHQFKVSFKTFRDSLQRIVNKVCKPRA